MKLYGIMLLVAGSTCIGQTVHQVELYGTAPALQVYNSLGTNISNNNEWEYQAAQAAHITWGRFDCSWQNVELQKLPENVSLGYSLPRGCASGLQYGKKYGVHPIVDALYGAPFGRIATATVTADAAVGATIIPITITSGSLTFVQVGQTYLKYKSANISAKHAYAGTLIISKSSDSVTLASALTSALPRGSTLTLNLQLYPPVFIAQGSNFRTNASIQAYGNYVHFLQTQIAASGFAGRVSLWNEPPWGGDPWDVAANLYDKPPAENRLKPLFGVDLAFYASTLPPVRGAPLDNGYTNKTANGSLFAPDRRSNLPPAGEVYDVFASESFHPYGNNPEDGAWMPSCIKSHSTPQTYGQVFRDCTPLGMVAGSNMKWEAAFNASFGGVHGLPLGITETGLCRCNDPDISETQVSRFDLRQFLVYAGLDVHPIVFYRLAGDRSFEWMRADHSAYPVYTAFQSLMKDLGSISSPPVVPYSPGAAPTIASYVGTYPLATVVFVGSRPGDKLNSLAFYTWQRSYSSKWVTLASPSAGSLSMMIPPGLAVASVKNTVTLAPVSYTVHGQTLSYSVADDPLEVLLLPKR